eukprot:2343465-Rhodomonas_salina.1
MRRRVAHRTAHLGTKTASGRISPPGPSRYLAGLGRPYPLHNPPRLNGNVNRLRGRTGDAHLLDVARAVAPALAAVAVSEG